MSPYVRRRAPIFAYPAWWLLGLGLGVAAVVLLAFGTWESVHPLRPAERGIVGGQP